ncbi:UDP-glucuronosyl/UDP-glucosyltransferase protein [Dioscorea alata]|uniref:UDP-glucuronosyl/UDP-glucosyltransferase protein n=1 Tax=Dioscorea alata TaxID=55571 RepID=A0ACB7VMD2_DIOAL|nr:UDP-glucuronosyl/UDP-glucosyltransferase protein [Dioscorea alata]
MNTADQPPPLHIAVFPWLAFGHMIPLLELSKSLAERGHQISYISTPRNISRLPKLPPNLSSLIHFIPLTLPKVSGLPDNAEATSDVSPEKTTSKKYSSSKLKRKLPDWIILDFATPWVASLASQFSIPCIFFSVFSTSSLAFIGPLSEFSLSSSSRTSPEHFTVLPNWISFPSNLSYSLNGARLFLNYIYRNNASGMPDITRLSSTLHGCKLVALRSCMELEPECLRLLPHLYNKPVIPVSLLPPSSNPKTSTDNTNDNEILKWLNKQEPNSVVYIAFGSEFTLSIELLRELASGLEMSELHFVWALRKPAEFEGEVLPEGFEERTRERGVVTLGWVPQLDVLGHSAVGGFLSHCGWSSVIEALWFGLPMVLLPLFVDHDVNAKVVEGKGFGVEVKRKEDDGSFDKESVANALRLVMVDDEGKEIRTKAKQVRDHVFGDMEHHEKYVDDFVKHLRDHRDV